MTAFQKWLVWSTSGLTGLTGLVYWWMNAFLDPLDEFAVINHPLQPWVLKAHIVVAPLLVFAVGVIWVGHVWKHFWRSQQRARRSGLTTMALLAPMILSGYLIQAVTAPAFLTLLVWVHIGSSLVYLVGLAAHKLGVSSSAPVERAGPRRHPGRRQGDVEPTGASLKRKDPLDRGPEGPRSRSGSVVERRATG